jgi:hypothetical protein
MDTATFYADDTGVHYAESRYLLYYLQDKGLLHAFYRQFRDARLKDPSGFGTLATVLGERDMDDFKKRWEKYVADLTFP